MFPHTSLAIPPLTRLGYLAALLPIVTIHAAFLVSGLQGHFEWCLPYWTDCISVSKTGRHGGGYILFKAGMIPAALLLALFWSQLFRHLIPSLPRTHWLIMLGWLASLALLTYTIALGHSGGGFYLLRRFGVVLFMALTFIVQVKAGSIMQTIATLASAGKCSVVFSFCILSIAIISLLLDAVLGAAYNRIENAFEWWLIMLLIANLLLIARAIKHDRPQSAVN